MKEPIGVSFMRRRAQLSAETLVVLAVFLSTLAVVSLSISHVLSASQHKLDETQSSLTFSDLSNSIGEACFLGNGNVRIVEVAGGPVELSFGDGAMNFSTQAFSSSGNFQCQINIHGSSFDSKIRIENINGAIEIS